MKQILAILLLIASTTQITSQTLTGQLKQHAGQTLSLTGFDYYKNYELATTTADSLGNFTLNYPKTYKGMGVLKTQDNSNLIVVLSENNISVAGNHLQEPNSIVYTNSVENTNFSAYAKTQQVYGNALSAWKFLDDIYQKEDLFKGSKKMKKAIKKEQVHLKKKNAIFLAKLAKESYIHWFIPYRKLVQEMPAIVRKETERIPEAIQKFRTTNFNHPNFKTSGLFKELIEGHYLLLENMGQSLDSVYKQMNVSTDYLITNLRVNDPLLNTVSDELFKYFEKRSLISVAAHLSNKLLTDNQCVLNDSLANSMQKYVTLKIGNIAPDIQLANSKLSDLKKPVLLVFGASWCPHCVTEKKALLAQYTNWQKTNKNIEVVYISLDTDKEAYNTAFKNTPWQNYCDFKGWDTQAAKDYFVNGTPTYLLLNKDLKILTHPNSLAHATSWVNYRL